MYTYADRTFFCLRYTTSICFSYVYLIFFLYSSEASFYFFLRLFLVIRCGFPGYCFLYPGQYTWLIGALPSLFFVCSYLAALVFGYLFADIERARGPLVSLANEANLAYG